MAMTDIIFIFWFLPLALGIYYIGKEKYRIYILLAISIFFYACGSLDYVLLLCVSVVVNIAVGGIIAKTATIKHVSLICLIVGIAYNLSILFYYKYFDFVVLNIGRVLKSSFEARNFLLPLGLSFFTFKAISYLIDIYTKKIMVDKNPARAALYMCFFAQVQSGPLSRYSDMYSEEKNEITFTNFSDGICRFMIGFCKKVLLSNVLANITTEIFDAGNNNVSSIYLWLGAIAYSLQLFYDFAGYSDMAIGISKMFGYDCPENFNYPYMAKSVSEFWRRWHITLGAWFREYVYIPLGGSRVDSRVRLYVNLFTVWILTGIWHGASWNFVIWGIAHFVIIAFEKTIGWPEKIKTRMGRATYRGFVLVHIVFQWVMFRSPGFINGIRYIRGMLSFNMNKMADARTIFLIKDNLFFIIVAIIFAFPIIPWLEEICRRKKWLSKVYSIVYVSGLGFMFLWAVSYIVAGQNNPFAYANF